MLWGKVLTAEKGRYNIMAASRREVGEGGGAEGRKGKTQLRRQGRRGKEGIFIVDDEHVWWDAVGARREEEERKS